MPDLVGTMKSLEGVLARSKTFPLLTMVDNIAERGESLSQCVTRLEAEGGDALSAARIAQQELLYEATLRKSEIARMEASELGVAEGTRLLNMSDPDRVVAALRQRSTEWSAGFMDSKAREIEELIRSGGVSAEVAPLLGQPVVTAHIPALKGSASHDLHLVPTGVIGRAKGFAAIEDARRAARNYLSLSPNQTAIITAGNDVERLHVVIADYSTAERVVAKRQGRLISKISLDRQGVQFTAHDDRVREVVTSDKQVAPPGFDGAMPENYGQPMSYNELDHQGLVAPKTAAEEMFELQLSHERQLLETGFSVNDRIAALKSSVGSVVRELEPLRPLAEALDQVPDRLGEFKSHEWLSGWRGVANKPMLGKSVNLSGRDLTLVAEDAIRQSPVRMILDALTGSEDGFSVVLQDYFGHALLYRAHESGWTKRIGLLGKKFASRAEAIDAYKTFDWQQYQPHRDLRAVVDHDNRVVLLLGEDGKVSVESTTPVRDHLIDEWFADLSKQSIVSNSTIQQLSKDREFQRWAWHPLSGAMMKRGNQANGTRFAAWHDAKGEQVRILEASSPMQAVGEVGGHEFEMWNHSDWLPVIVELPDNLKRETGKVFGAVKVRSDISFPENIELHPSLRALVEFAPGYDPGIKGRLLTRVSTVERNAYNNWLAGLQGRQIYPGRHFSILDSRMKLRTADRTSMDLRTWINHIAEQKNLQNAAIIEVPDNIGENFRGVIKKYDIIEISGLKYRRRRMPKLGQPSDYAPEVKAIIVNGRIRLLDHANNKITE